jgi:hypothetical protein
MGACINTEKAPKLTRSQSRLRERGIIVVRVLNKFAAHSLRSLAPSAVVLGLAATSAGALTINDDFVGVGGYTCPAGVTGCSNFSNVTTTTMAQIVAATNQIASYFSNNVTVNIIFGAGAANNGAESIAGYYGNYYAAYTTLLSNNSAANPGNTVLKTAVANLAFGNGAAGTITAGLPVVEDSAELRANGQGTATGGFTNNGTTFDGVVLLGTTAAIAAAIHEIDEVMGGGGAGSMLGNQGTSAFCANFNPSGKCLGGTDLYRYSANNTPSFNITQAAYLSVNGGATSIAQFNNGGVGDTGDFTTSPCLIQSWQVCTGFSDFNGTSYGVGSVAYQMMESVGWDPTSVGVPGPVPGAGLPGMALDVGAIGLSCWRRKQKPAGTAA